MSEKHKPGFLTDHRTETTPLDGNMDTQEGDEKIYHLSESELKKIIIKFTTDVLVLYHQNITTSIKEGIEAYQKRVIRQYGPIFSEVLHGLGESVSRKIIKRDEAGYIEEVLEFNPLRRRQ